jgi:UDP-N-acetylmuramoylalanine--D-glutamate ligase
MRKDRIKGKNISVLGMARSGIACAKLLKKTGAEVFVSEVKNKEALIQETKQLSEMGIEFETGGHTPDVLTETDFVIVSPGIPPDIPILVKAQEMGIPVFSEIEVAFWLTDARIVGITGSNGKTTTVTLVGQMLKEDKQEHMVGGNIGLPFSGIVEQVSPNGYLVLELSSFQLERIEEFRPYVSSVLNITADHLDRHPDLKSYMEAKMRIMENQTENDFVVLNADDENTLKLAQFAPSRKVFFSTKSEVGQGAFVREGKLYLRCNGGEKEIIETNQIGIKGPHNLYNACAACAICGILGASPGSMRTALRYFRGVPHRLEVVKTVSGVSFVNDSKATNVDSVWYALQSVSPPIILIAGGKDKGGDFSILQELVKKNVKALILIGEARDKIKVALGNLIPTYDSQNLEEAVRLGYSKASPGDTVLLSPGCASFDMFKDYEHRGRVFKDSVMELSQDHETGTTKQEDGK